MKNIHNCAEDINEWFAHMNVRRKIIRKWATCNELVKDCNEEKSISFYEKYRVKICGQWIQVTVTAIKRYRKKYSVSLFRNEAFRNILFLLMFTFCESGNKIKIFCPLPINRDVLNKLEWLKM